jgi:hypothetical protein
MEELRAERLKQTHRTCSHCKATKPLDQFKETRRDGRWSRSMVCRPCLSWKQAERARKRKIGRGYSTTEKQREQARKRYWSNREAIKLKAKWIRYYSKYRITEEEFRARLAACENKCEICSKEFGDIFNAPSCDKPCVDHCHATGEVRGLLCSACNASLGGFRDSPQLMLQAIAYIGKTSTEQAA